ncbi:MAG: 2Fe-2S iron-sulfur cluster-binding protein [Rhizomicrobium sp.]
MTFRVDLLPSGHSFEAPPDKPLLQAAIEGGVIIAYSCRAGSCRTCIAKVVSGSIDYVPTLNLRLSAEEKAAGYTLLCRALACSDVVMEVEEISLATIKPVVLPCRIADLAYPAPDVAVATLKLPPQENLSYVPGQYVSFLLDGGLRRNYSLARPCRPAERPRSRFISAISRAATSPTACSPAKSPSRQILKFEGPLGTFYLREDSDKPIMFVASGTGFAPIKAICESIFERRIARDIVLYWAAAAGQTLYERSLR